MTFHDRLPQLLIAAVFALSLGGCSTVQFKPGTYLIEFFGEKGELLHSIKVPTANAPGELSSRVNGSTMLNRLERGIEVMNVRNNLCKTMPGARSVITSQTGEVMRDEKCPQLK